MTNHVFLYHCPVEKIYGGPNGELSEIKVTGRDGKTEVIELINGRWVRQTD